ncbi:Dyp-type peroxidase [Bradyrhizobium sp. AUGA SZCCT0169]|nr:Dyp-type peroxidase [Bradyrhizobium sp. AUGA SZCCT0169]
MDRVEWEDVQGIVLSGYGELKRSAYLLLRFQSGDLARKREWLSDLTTRLTPVQPGPSSKTQPARNLALTASGLRHFGVDQSTLSSFSFEFLEGMAPVRPLGAPIPRRTNVLGDLEDSSPEYWHWGGWNEKSREIDGLLMLFAEETGINQLIQAEMTAMADIVDGEPIVLMGQLFPKEREHFGFEDGFSQPKIEGRPKKSKGANPKNRKSEIKPNAEVKAGEFLLGYENERKARVTNGHDRDIRRNGTYLVFRQLEQNVPAFNTFVSDVARKIGETDDWVAARLLGRGKDGEPLVAEKPNGSEEDAKNNFLYYYEDRSGLRCPIGAHIRRANPRDSLGPDPETAMHLSKMHRIIRRGRPYGERWEPNGANGHGDKAERGMLFIALNADIAGQFEMIQHSWINNPHFNGLYTGTDPISHFPDGEGITIQSRPANLRVDRAKPFVTVRGGAYFFLPGLRALRDIAAPA